jgi:regulator of chromosome condensation
MESGRQAPKKRKAAPAEEPATKKPRTTIKPSSSTTRSAKTTTADKAKSIAKAPAMKKAAKETDKAPATKKAAKETEKAPGKKAPGKKRAAKETAKAKQTPAKASGVKGKKRVVPDDADADIEEESEKPAPSPKQAKVSKQPNGAKSRTRAPPKLPVINAVPTVILDVYVFGEGSASELGLGNAKNAINVKRPRLNPNLSAKEVGVVAVACGGMHSAAITHDNLILTWGVNDLGALGRDTTWNGAWKDTNTGTDESIDDDEVALNPQECNPGAISPDHFPEGTKFAALACGDSSTFVLTDTGLVYGWGTFRVRSIVIIRYTSELWS